MALSCLSHRERDWYSLAMSRPDGIFHILVNMMLTQLLRGDVLLGTPLGMIGLVGLLKKSQKSVISGTKCSFQKVLTKLAERFCYFSLYLLDNVSTPYWQDLQRVVFSKFRFKPRKPLPRFIGTLKTPQRREVLGMFSVCSLCLDEECVHWMKSV